MNPTYDGRRLPENGAVTPEEAGAGSVERPRAEREKRFDDSVRVSVRGMIPAAVALVGVAVVFIFLPAVKSLLLGTLAAAGVAAVLKPLARKVPGPKAVGALVVGLATAGLVLVLAGLALFLVVRPVREQMSQWPQTREAIESRLDSWGSAVGVDMPALPEIGNRFVQWAGGALGRGGGEGLGGMVAGTVGALGNGALAALIVLIGAMYLLSTDIGKMLRPVTRDLPKGQRRAVHGLVRDLDKGLRGWMIATLIAMASAGVATYLGYKFAGLRFAPAVALLAALGETIPNLGPIAAFLVALLIAVTQSASTVVWVVAMYVLIQTVQSYIVQPLAVKRTVNIPEFITLLTVVAWGIAFGAAGLIMATPLNLFVWSVYERFISPTRRRRVQVQHRMKVGPA